MDFSVLASSGYRLDCDRDEVANVMVVAPPIASPPAPAPEAVDSPSRSRKEKQKKRKEKKEKKKRSEKAAEVELPKIVVDEPGPDKGKARRGINGEEPPVDKSAPSVKVVAPDEAYAVPSIFELVFAAPKSSPPDLAEFPMPVEPESTVAEIKERLFQRERYLLRSMQFFFEGRELKNPEVFRSLGVRNHSTIHLRNVFSAVNIQPFFGEPFPLTHTGPNMTVVELLTTLLSSSRFHFANLRFFRLSIASAEPNANPIPIDLDKFINWPDEPLAWSTKMSDLEDKLTKGFWLPGREPRLQPWTSVKMTTLTAETTVRELDSKMRKDLNAHRRVDAPPGLVYLYRQDEPPFGAMPLDGNKPVKGQWYFSWRRPPPQPAKFHANATTLADLGIKVGSTLLLDFWSESSSRWASEIAKKYTSRGIELRLTFPSGRIILLSTGLNDLVELLMWKIFCAIGFAPEDQLLVLKGKQLTREQSLGSQGARDGDTIVVVRRVRAVY